MHSTKLLFNELVIRQKLSTKCPSIKCHAPYFWHITTSFISALYISKDDMMEPQNDKNPFNTANVSPFAICQGQTNVGWLAVSGFTAL